MFRIYWRIKVFIIIQLIYEIKANNKPHDKIFISLDKFEFEISNKALVRKLETSLPSSNQLSAEFTLNQNITEFDLKLKFDMIKKDNRQMNLAKFDFDGCRSLELAYIKFTAIKVAMSELLRTANIPKKCPILANKPYYVRNYTINAKDYPDIIPAMHWQLTMNFFMRKKYQGKMIMKGQVQKS